ncbi:hypothetical protein FVEN_g42 [Fusarium venenatum]|nr:hypothetical protein FVEN_g42 [Fusarium venenatum]
MNNYFKKTYDMKQAESYEPGEMLRPVESVAHGAFVQSQQPQRRLNNRQIQLIAIGPAGLLLASIFYCFFVGLVNNGMAEMMTQHPVAGGFISLAGHFVDDAFGFAAGWNFFIYEALVIPFEISAMAIVVQYWSDDILIWTMCLACNIFYTLINCLVVNAYGEAEF